MIHFWCQCGRQLKVSDRAAGEVVQCGLCRRLTMVPEEDAPRTGDFPPVPPRGRVSANGEITRQSVGVLAAASPTEGEKAEQQPKSRLARAAWALGGPDATDDDIIRSLYDQLPFHFKDPHDPRITEFRTRTAGLLGSVAAATLSEEHGPGIEIEDRLGSVTQPVLLLAGRHSYQVLFS